MSIRYLWITIRAINYTDRAFNAISKSIGALQKDEAKLTQTANVLKLSAGMMWMALGAMAISGITQMIRVTREGRTVMNAFDRSIRDLTKAFGTAFTTVLRVPIQLLTNFLNALSKLDPRILAIISLAVLFGIGLMTIAGAIWVVQGVMGILNKSFLSNILTLKMWHNMSFSVIASTQGLGRALSLVRFSLAQVIGVFSIFLALGMLLGSEGAKWAAVIAIIATAVAMLAIWLSEAAIAWGVLTFGLAAAGGLAVAALMPSHQVGTRKAQFTGPAIIHAGERIGQESQLKKEFGGKQGVEKTQTNVTIAFSGNIQTKADKEQLKPLILKWVKEALDNKA